MSNPAAWTFWLKERQVTGVIVAEHRDEKLVEYGKRFYIVKGKDPQKKHYTQSTIPALWKKVMNGQLRIEEELKELGITKKMVKEAVAFRDKQVKRSRESAVPPSPSLRGKVKPAAKPGTSTVPPTQPERKPRREKAPRTDVTTDSAAAPAVERQRSAGRKMAASPPPPADPGNLLWLECPYCKELELMSALDQEIGKALIRRCGKCKQEFGIRVVPVAFRIEVAPFPGKTA